MGRDQSQRKKTVGAGGQEGSYKSTNVRKVFKSFPGPQHAGMHAVSGINMVSLASVCSCRARMWTGSQSYGLELCNKDFRLLGKSSPGSQIEEVALYMREQLECIEHCLRMDEERQRRSNLMG